MSWMNERGTMPKPLFILTCQDWTNVAPCWNHCPYWHVRNEWAMSASWHRDEAAVHTECSVVAACQHPEWTAIRTDISLDSEVRAVNTEHILMATCQHPGCSSVHTDYSLDGHTSFDRVLLPMRRINIKNHEAPNCKGPVHIERMPKLIFSLMSEFLPTAREGNVFRGVYHSVHEGSASRTEVCLQRGDLLPGESGYPPRYWHLVAAYWNTFLFLFSLSLLFFNFFAFVRCDWALTVNKRLHRSEWVTASLQGVHSFKHSATESIPARHSRHAEFLLWMQQFRWKEFSKE